MRSEVVDASWRWERFDVGRAWVTETFLKPSADKTQLGEAAVLVCNEGSKQEPHLNMHLYSTRIPRYTEYFDESEALKVTQVQVGSFVLQRSTSSMMVT